MRDALGENKIHPHRRSGQGSALITLLGPICLILCAACCYQALRLSKQITPPAVLRTAPDLFYFLQQLSREGPSPAYAADVQALARHIEGQLEQVKELSLQLEKANADLNATKTVLAKQEQALEQQSKDAAQKHSELEKQYNDATQKHQQLEKQAKEATDKHQELEKQAKEAAEKAKAAEEKQKELEAKLQQAQAQQPAVLPTAEQQPAAAAAVREEARLQALATAGDTCGTLRNAEFWGDVVVWGTHHRTVDAAECCAACWALKRTIARGGTDRPKEVKPCNIWVYCGDKEKCGDQYRECWLKHQNISALLPPASPAGAIKPDDNRWVSGVLHNPDEVIAFAADDHAREQKAIMLHTSLGDVIEVQLLPDLAPGSVRELQRFVALLTGFPAASAEAESGGTSNGNSSAAAVGYCSGCRVYRVEKGWLIQGVMEAPGGYVGVPRQPNPPQKMVMDRGLVCWAGGGGGPHWFVNMIDNSSFKDDHLCFGKVSEDDLKAFEKMVMLPLKEKKNPGDMNILKDDVLFNVSFKQTPTEQTKPPP